MRASLVVLFVASVAFADVKVVGAGARSGASAPFVLNAAASSRQVTVGQYLYTAAELGFPAGSHLVELAWQKDYSTGSGTTGCAVELWLKNVSSTALAGSQTFADAKAGATRVMSTAAWPVPATMGFVSFAAIDFGYTGGALEVLTVADCRSATFDGPILWRYDVAPGLGRGAITAAMPETLAPLHPFSDRRPQTRFRALVPGKKLEVRIPGGGEISNGASFAPAPNYLAAMVGVPNRYELVNEGLEAVGGVAVSFPTTMNVAVALEGAAFTSLAPGERRALELRVTPAATGMTRWSTRVDSDDPARPTTVWNVIGTAQATAAPQPAFSHVTPDGRATALPAGADTMFTWPRIAGVPFELGLRFHNYGSGLAAPLSFTERMGTVGLLVSAPVLATSLEAQADLDARTQLRRLLGGGSNAQLNLELGTAVRGFALLCPEPPPDIAVYELVGFDATEVEIDSRLDVGREPGGVDQDFLIENPGEGVLRLPSGAIIENERGCTVELVERPDGSVEPGGVTWLGIRVTPTSAGHWSYRVRIPNNVEGADPFIFDVEGGPRPKLELEFWMGPGGLLLPQHPVKQGEELWLGNPIIEARETGLDRVQDVVTYIVRNTGDAPLVVTDITAGPAKSLTKTSVGRPVISRTMMTVAPGESEMFSVGLAELLSDTSVNDEMKFDMTLVSNDPAQPTFTWKTSVSNYDSPFQDRTCRCDGAPGFSWLLIAVLASRRQLRRRAQHQRADHARDE
ncbi:MAG: hypothetical protein JNK82_09140 [Myxococcaceae bacterium]|nr:hypothetical protein [Myxococcaceae bacterium]